MMGKSSIMPGTTVWAMDHGGLLGGWVYGRRDITLKVGEGNAIEF